MPDTLDQPGPTGPGQARQRQQAGPESRIHYITYREFETMDTQSSRIGLPTTRFAWLENLQPVGKNRLEQVPGPASVLQTYAANVVKAFYATYGPVGGSAADYEIAFLSDGSMWQLNLVTGVLVNIATAGTFTNPDVTQWQSRRIVIADPTAGYCTWDGSVFVKAGGVSPNIVITNPGSGYTSGATATITGGSGSGALVTVQTTGGFVSNITLTNPGSGYKAGDTLTVTITPVSGGSGAAATAIVFPILTFPNMTTLAVFQGRVWIGAGRTLFWTGTNGFDDSATANASGSTIISDADLAHSITALRSLNNFLYIMGDSSIKQIGAIAVSSGVTLFTIITLSSDQGTIFPQSIIAFNRLVVFVNFVGVWAIFGATVEKISDPMDGVFQSIVFTQLPVCVTTTINDIQVLLVLVEYADPNLGNRSIFMSFMNRKWFIISQGSNYVTAIDATINGVSEVFCTVGAAAQQILANPAVATNILVRSALADDNGAIMKNKRGIRVGIAQSATAVATMALTTESENFAFADSYVFGNFIIWLNNAQAVVQWQNGTSGNVIWSNPGFQFTYREFNATGIYLGLTLSGTFTGYNLNNMVVEYEDGPYMRSVNHA